MQKYEIINKLIKHFKYKSYLEIGLDNPNNNFTKVNCELKESVDPYFKEDHRNGWDCMLSEDIKKEIDKYLTYKMTSDEFFANNTKKYDIILIDGLHTKEQVGKDIINSLKCLNKNGKIIVHDCLPPNEERQIVPRRQRTWNGDVWRTIPELKKQNIRYYTVDTDEGCAIIDFKPSSKKLKYVESWDNTWEDFKKHKNELMNVIKVKDFDKLILI